MSRLLIALLIALSVLSFPAAVPGADLFLHCSLESQPSIGEFHPATAVVTIVNGTSSPLENVTLQLISPSAMELTGKVWQAGTIAVGEVGIRTGAVRIDLSADSDEPLLWQVDYKLAGATRSLVAQAECTVE